MVCLDSSVCESESATVCRSFQVSQSNDVFARCLYGTGVLFEKRSRIVDYLSMPLGILRIVCGFPIFGYYFYFLYI
jgi:hypothetical protein